MFNIWRDFCVPYVTFIAQIHWMYNIQAVGCFFCTNPNWFFRPQILKENRKQEYIMLSHILQLLYNNWVYLNTRAQACRNTHTHTHFCFVLCFLFLSFLSFFMKLYPFFSLFYSLYISFYLSFCFFIYFCQRPTQI